MEPKEALKLELDQLRVWELHRILDHKEEFLLDGTHYSDGKFSPLAVAYALNKLPNPSNDFIKVILARHKLEIFPIKGATQEDFIEVVREVINEKFYHIAPPK